MVKTKFPSLYTILKTGDLNTLVQYFETYPETSTITKLVAGKQLSLFEQANDFGQIPIIKFLIDKTPPDQLVNLMTKIIYSMKYNREPNGNEAYQYFSEKIFNLIDTTGSVELTKLLESMFYLLCTCGFVIHDNVITELLNNRLLDLKNKLHDLDFQWKFTNKILSAPCRVYKLIVNYYNENQLNQAQLLATYLICSDSKSDSIIKLFKSVELKTKVSINPQKPLQVQLSNLFVISGAPAKLANLLANPDFESELIETIKNIISNDFSSYKLKLGGLICAINGRYNLRPYYWGKNFIDIAQLDYLKLFESKLTNVFWSWLLELNKQTKDEKEKAIADKLIKPMIKE